MDTAEDRLADAHADLCEREHHVPVEACGSCRRRDLVFHCEDCGGVRDDGVWHLAAEHCGHLNLIDDFDRAVPS